METQPKEILILYALDLDLPELINFCRSNKIINDKVCNNKDFWFQRLYKDFDFDLNLIKKISILKFFINNY